MYYFTGQTILLRDILKLATIVKKVDEERYLCSYYDENNKFKYKVSSNQKIEKIWL